MRNCPTCQGLLATDVELCPNCGQEFCPDCRAPLPAEVTRCENCGAEFQLLCPQCEQEIDPAAETCPFCGLSFVSSELAPESESEAHPTTDERAEWPDQEELTLRPCPECETLLYEDDNFCPECGQMFCGRCRKPVDEEDDTCPHCGVELYFACPLCGFELAAGSTLCPNCNAFFPAHCPICRASLPPGSMTCPACQAAVPIRQRRSARVVQNVLVGDQVLAVVSCPGCGHSFDPVAGPCRHCQTRVCPQCQLVLEADEAACPRCGATEMRPVPIPGRETRCPTCRSPITPGSDVCPTCQQLLCPDCLGPVDEDDLVCPHCGSEFELVCPGCNEIIETETEVCPQCGLTF
jgi:RNA polymerase subunit RPABC4/transcription elongation factor Spt4